MTMQFASVAPVEPTEVVDALGVNGLQNAPIASPSRHGVDQNSTISKAWTPIAPSPQMASSCGSGEQTDGVLRPHKFSVDSRGSLRVDDFDGEQSEFTTNQGQRADMPDLSAHKYLDKPAGLPADLQSMMEYLDSRLSACEHRVTEKMNEHFLQLTEKIGSNNLNAGLRPAKLSLATPAPLTGVVKKKETLKSNTGACPRPPQAGPPEMPQSSKSAMEVLYEPPERSSGEVVVGHCSLTSEKKRGTHLLTRVSEFFNSFGRISEKRNTQRTMISSWAGSQFDRSSESSRRDARLFQRVRTDMRAKGVFIDEEEKLSNARKKMLRPSYTVVELYKKEGVCQKIARSHTFEIVTQAVICANAVWMAIDLDYNHAAILIEAHPIFIVGENLFNAYFTAEWFVRFIAFRQKCDAITDPWFVLDSMLVAMIVLETCMTMIFLLNVGDSSSTGLGNASILRLVRLMRLTRMARIAKVLQAVPELMIVLKGMSIASRSVFFMFCLLVVAVYIFAIAFRQIAEDTAIGKQYFSSVPHSMISLLLQCQFSDVSDFFEAVGDASVVLGILLLIFICFGTLTLLNMLIGVLVEVVTVTAAIEKEQITIHYVKHMLEGAFLAADIGTSLDDVIRPTDFDKLLQHPDAHTALASVGVDVIGLLDMSEFIFTGGAALTFSDFLEVVLRFRGSNRVSVKDVVDLRLFLSSEIQQLRFTLADVAQQLPKGNRSSAMTAVSSMPSIGSSVQKSSN